jgi:hypothetical protein
LRAYDRDHCAIVSAGSKFAADSNWLVRPRKLRRQEALREAERLALIDRWENAPSPNPEYEGMTPGDAARLLFEQRRNGREQPDTRTHLTILPTPAILFSHSCVTDRNYWPPAQASGQYKRWIVIDPDGIYVRNDYIRVGVNVAAGFICLWILPLNANMVTL